jgi:hypothetical protein
MSYIFGSSIDEIIRVQVFMREKERTMKGIQIFDMANKDEEQTEL